MLFIQEKRKEYVGTEKQQGRSFGEIMRMLADDWHALTPEGKKPYVERAEMDKVRLQNQKDALANQMVEKPQPPFVETAKQV